MPSARLFHEGSMLRRPVLYTTSLPCGVAVVVDFLGESMVSAAFAVSLGKRWKSSEFMGATLLRATLSDRKNHSHNAPASTRTFDDAIADAER